MKLEFDPVTTSEQILLLAQTAAEVWHEHFISILQEQQINYMVDKFQSADAVTEQIEKQGYRYFLLLLEGSVIGYTGFRTEGNRMFLSKIYILKQYRKKGYASETFAFLEEMCRGMDLISIWLTVNRNNLDSIQVYERLGFDKTKTQVTDIGNGFVMDDYIMEKQL